jgi:hypothetical protein
MESNIDTTSPSDEKRAVQHLTEADSLLNDPRNEVNQHPKLVDAIQKLELALSLLTTKSGGML